MSKIHIKTLVVGQLAANCYLVINKDTNKTTIIDPGDDVEYIQNTINDLGVVPDQIIATHGHFDHIMAARDMQLAYQIPFLIYQKDEFLVKNLRQSSQHFLHLDSGPPPQIDKFIDSSKTIPIAEEDFEIFHTPGHTPGSLSFYHQQSHMLISGDVIFAGGGVGRYDFSYSNKNELLKSIQEILTLPPKTTIYPGHGNTSTISEEQIFHH